ncbi:UNVERIFIED_ORG: hypothetical protein J2W66_002894 [Agrobacterium larrymoorei]|nr:hypothetical protein [Agrobacterium larrymoorei]
MLFELKTPSGFIVRIKLPVVALALLFSLFPF